MLGKNPDSWWFVLTTYVPFGFDRMSGSLLNIYNEKNHSNLISCDYLWWNLVEALIKLFLVTNKSLCILVWDGLFTFCRAGWHKGLCCMISGGRTHFPFCVFLWSRCSGLTWVVLSRGRSLQLSTCRYTPCTDTQHRFAVNLASKWLAGVGFYVTGGFNVLLAFICVIIFVIKTPY